MSVYEHHSMLKINAAVVERDGDVLTVTFSEYIPPDPKPPTPTPTTEDIILYRNSAEMDVVDKSLYLEEVKTISGVFRDVTSIINPSIVIEYNSVPDFNYVYIGVFNRYYAVTGITSVRTNLWEISLSIDVLMTYKNVILSTTAFVDRNERFFDLFLADNKIVVDEGYNITDTVVENGVFSNSAEVTEDNPKGEPEPLFVATFTNSPKVGV